MLPPNVGDAELFKIFDGTLRADRQILPKRIHLRVRQDSLLDAVFVDNIPPQLR
jgi:hypothetical protein